MIPPTRVVTPRQHREVDAFTALVGADEERGPRTGERAPLADRGGAETPRLPCDTHPVHLVGHDVEVADHERHDLHHLVRQVQAAQAVDEGVRLGGRREREARGDADRRLDEQRPCRLQPVRADRHAEEGGLRTGREERKEQGEHHEGELDEHPRQEVAERDPRHDHHPEEEHRVQREDGVGRPGRGHDDEHEAQQREQLEVGGCAVDGGVTGEVQLVPVRPLLHPQGLSRTCGCGVVRRARRLRRSPGPARCR